MRWDQPPARWGLRAGKQPQKHPGLSGVVVILDQEGRGFAYIRFEQPLVDALAREMQYGISPLHPCHLRLLQTVVGGNTKWRLICHYIGNPVGKMVYEYPDKPEWLGKIYREASNGSNT